jgi:2,4-dienoyl-CoA reductase-like NADH-dependent reductase (Old Yellow Enzyme family)
MPTLFEPTRINSMLLANRCVRSATWEGMATPRGEVTPGLIEMMVEPARTGRGL